MRIRFSGALGRARTTATVAAMSDSSTKKWEAWKPSSVEISELIVQPLAQRGVVAGRRGHGGGLRRGSVATAPADGDETDQRRARYANEVRHRPGELVESSIERLRQNVLAAVIGDERLQHLLAGHPLRQERVQLPVLLVEPMAVRPH